MKKIFLSFIMLLMFVSCGISSIKEYPEYGFTVDRSRLMIVMHETGDEFRYKQVTTKHQFKDESTLQIYLNYNATQSNSRVILFKQSADGSITRYDPENFVAEEWGDYDFDQIASLMLPNRKGFFTDLSIFAVTPWGSMFLVGVVMILFPRFMTLGMRAPRHAKEIEDYDDGYHGVLSVKWGFRLMLLAFLYWFLLGRN